MTTGGSILDDLKWKFRHGGMLTRLIMINVGVFLGINIIRVFLTIGGSEQLYNTILGYLMLPATPLEMLKQPWSLFTYMFLHTGFLHILFNMLWLFWFGLIFKEYVGESRIMPVYIMGALFGAGLTMLTQNTIPFFIELAGPMLGASAGVMAIVLAVATLMPNHQIHLLFLGPVRLKWIAATVVVLDFLSITGGNAGGHVAHLGGALFGYLYMTSYRNGSDWSKPFYSVWDGIVNFFDFSKKPKKSKVKVAYKNKANQSSAKKKKSVTEDKQAKIDEILDKISRSGYESLTKEEKAFLFSVSKE